MNRYLVFWALFISSGCLSLKAQEVSLPLTYQSYALTQDDGLSQGSNYFRFEDSRGFMWISALDAVNRYDGAYNKVYNLNKYFDNCKPLKQCYGIVEDGNSNMYFGSEDGLYIYNREKDMFTLQKMFADKGEQLAIPFAFDNNEVWCYNKKYQLITYNVSTNSIQHKANLAIPPMIGVNVYQQGFRLFFYSLPFIDKNRIIHVTTPNKLYIYNLATKKLADELSKVTNSNINFNSSTYVKDSHKIYYATDNGVIISDLNNNTYKIVQSIGGISIKESYETNVTKNYLAIKTRTSVLLTNHSLSKCIELKSRHLPSSFQAINIGFDKDDRLWMCKNGEGQVIFDFRRLILPNITNQNLQLTNVNEFGIGRISESPKGKIFVEVLIQNKVFSKFLFESSTGELLYRHSLSNDYITGYYTHQLDTFNNLIWYVAQLSKAKRTIISELKDNLKLKTIDTIPISHLDLIHSFRAIDKEHLIISAQKGVYLYAHKTGHFEKLKGCEQLGAFYIQLLSKNRMALSYLGGEMKLYAFNESKEVKLLKTILPGVQSFYLQEDTLKQQYWVGANDGVYCLDKDFHLLKKIDVNNGLAGNYIYGLLIGNDGNIYCSHQKGLSFIDAQTYQVINFDRRDGIQNWDFNNRSFCKLRDGTLCFGGISGFNYFKTPLSFPTTYKTQLYIDEILINNKTYPLPLSADNVKSLDLKANENIISLKTIIKSLSNATSFKIAYRLKETDSSWSYLPSNSNIIFNNLAPNDYTLQLGYLDKFTNKVILQKELVICIATPFYKNILFWVAISMLLSAIFFYLLSKQKSRKQEAYFQQQLQLQQQRAQITADLHDDMGSALSALQMNTALANMQMDKDPIMARQILDSVEQQSKNVSEKLSDLIWSIKPGEEEFLNFSSRIKNFTNEILGALEINYTVNITPTIDMVLTEVNVRKNLLFFLKEAINNAAKYSKADQINVEVLQDGQEIVATVKDNGIGFLPNNKGNGLRTMQRRIDELRGTLSIDSASNQGTTIKATVPILNIKDTKKKSK